MCVDCVLASLRLAQADPGRRTPPRGGSVIETSLLPFLHFLWCIVRDHYMSLQRFTMGRMPGLAKVVRGTIAMLRFPVAGLD
jgi:hypothetical protein